MSYFLLTVKFPFDVLYIQNLLLKEPKRKEDSLRRGKYKTCSSIVKKNVRRSDIIVMKGKKDVPFVGMAVI